jgi:transcriptional regulator with XRE-family HTH domain
VAAPQTRTTRDAHERQTRVLACGVDKPERDRLLSDFGQKLRSLRTAAGLSQGELAKRCFLRPDHISALERGAGIPDLPILLMLADAVGATVTELTAGLSAPTRQAGRDQVLALIPSSPPGITTSQLSARAIGLPAWYVTQLLRYLESDGEIAPTAVQGRVAWHQDPSAQAPPSNSTSARQPANGTKVAQTREPGPRR